MFDLSTRQTTHCRHAIYSIVRRESVLALGICLSSARRLTLGKAFFVEYLFAERMSPSITLGKPFAECNLAFAECFKHSANVGIPVVHSS